METFRNILTVLSLIAATMSVKSETIVLKPGLLPSLIKEWRVSQPCDLNLQGEATALDLVSFKYLPASVQEVDMSRLTIKGITLHNSQYMERSEFYDNEIPPYAFFATNIKRVKLPSSVSIIGEAAFAETPLETIEIPASVSSIGPRAFYMCGTLLSVDLSSSSIRVVPEQCFYACSSMKQILLPSSVTAVESRAFMKSDVERLDVPSVSVIGDYAFAEMPSLTEIEIRNGAKLGEGAFFNDGVLGHIAGTPSNSAALAMANTAVVTILGAISGDVVEEGAYANLKADAIVIHPAVKEIKDYAFRNAGNLKSVDVKERGGDVPVCSPEAFSGVDVGKVSLVVSKEDEDPWRTAPIWKDFKIVAEDAGINDIVGEPVRIDVVRVGDDVRISSDHSIDQVEVFSLSGMLLAESFPNAEECMIGPLDENMVLVCVTTNGIVKFVKIMK